MKKNWWLWVCDHALPLLAAFIVFVGISLTTLGILVYKRIYPSWKWAHEFDISHVTSMPATTMIYDRHGYILQRIYEENRLPVRQEQIPEQLRQAVIASEDKRFYQHHGYDSVAIFRAFIGNLIGVRVSSGASTITQQLARNSAGMFERTVDRKIKEIFLARRIEQAFSKDEIITLYLNRIFFGKNIYGIGAAADAYFGKTVENLNLSEVAMLAGIISGPNSFSPWNNPEKAKLARTRALTRMQRKGFINQSEADHCESEPLVLKPLIDLPTSHAVSAIMDEIPEEINLNIHGGLRIYTTLDMAFQNAAEKELDRTLQQIESSKEYKHSTRAAFLKLPESKRTNPDYLQGAFVAIHNGDGGILCMVGGRNYAESTLNRAIASKRQVGSTLKPFVYAQFLQNKNAAGFTEIDSTPFNLTRPKEAFLNGFPHYLTVRDALRTSNNYCAMRAALAADIKTIAEIISEATGGEKIDPYPSTALGACSLSPLQLAQAFSVFPNQGIWVKPHFISRIETCDGTVIYRHIDTRRFLFSSPLAFQVHDLMRDVVDKGTGSLLRSNFDLKGEIAGKTGTTNNFKDCWFAGYTSAMTAVVWVGLDRPKQILPQGYASRIALPVWGHIMQLADAEYPPLNFPIPPNVRKSERRKALAWFFFKAKPSDVPSDYIREDQPEPILERLTSNMVQASAEAHQQADLELPGEEAPSTPLNNRATYISR